MIWMLRRNIALKKEIDLTIRPKATTHTSTGNLTTATTFSVSNLFLIGGYVLLHREPIYRKYSKAVQCRISNRNGYNSRPRQNPTSNSWRNYEIVIPWRLLIKLSENYPCILILLVCPMIRIRCHFSVRLRISSSYSDGSIAKTGMRSVNMQSTTVVNTISIIDNTSI